MNDAWRAKRLDRASARLELVPDLHHAEELKRLMINVDNQDPAEPKTIEDRQVAVGDRSRFLTALNEATNRSKRARAIRGVGR